MGEIDPFATQRDGAGIAAELAAAGFEEPEQIGRGGFGVVYRCLQRALDRAVAVKLLTTDLDEENLDRFLREQRAMGRLSGHPHIVNILQSGVTSAGQPYIVMPYHRHNSLEARVRAEGPLDWEEAVSVGVKVAGALETAHRVGTLHRDVKPANILLTEFGEPQLTDFGIARVTGGFETTAGTFAGSPAFTAPEVLRGLPATPASDVYGLGSTLFCLITGHAAYERRSGEQVVAQFLRITTEPVPDLRPGGTPADVCAVVEAAMSEEPAARPASAAALGEALREVQRRHGLRVDEMAIPDGLEADPDRSDSTAAFPAPSATTGRRDRRVPVVRTPGGTTTPPVPETRFRPPTPTRSLVERSRLIAAMHTDERRRLTVVHAPAGYGKSTLAAQWRDVLVADGVAVAWLTVDDDDNNVVWFLAHLVEAIRRVQPALAGQLQLTLEEHADEAERYVLTSLVNEIHDRGVRTAVIVDDWHRVTDPASIEALNFLLENGCHHLQILVTTRSIGGLPMSRMRVRQELVEIDSTALRFATEESQRMLVELGGLRMTRADVAELNESTDGWAAALQLAALSLRESEDPSTLIDSISGGHQAIAEYLAENVLDTMDSTTLEFMLATSVTARTCGDLASELSGIPRGLAMLEDVERRDLFLRRIDDGHDRDWFRYHQLFAKYLRRRLERDHPERVPELHRTAAQWLAAHDNLSEAVDHALESGDPPLAVDLVEVHSGALVERSQLATLLGLAGKLPPTLAATRPRLQLSVAWSNALLQRLAPTRTALELVDATLDRSGLSPVEIGDLRAEASVVEGVLAVSTGRLDGVRELTSACLDRAESLRPWVVSAAANITSLWALQRYEFAEVRSLQRWAARYHEQSSSPYNAMYGYCFAGIAANEELDVDAAEHNFRTALTHAARLGGGHSHISRLAGSLLGNLLYERGDVVAAEQLLDESIGLPSETAAFDFRFTSLGAGPRIRALRGTLASTASELWGLANGPLVDHTRDASSADRPTVGAPEVSGLAEFTAELEEIAGIRALIAENVPGAAETATSRAREIAARLGGGDRARSGLEARRLLVACLAAAGHLDEAKDTLAPVAATCAELGLVRFLLDEGPHLVTVVAALAADRRSDRWPSDRPAVPLEFLEEVLVAAEPDARG
ncbi:protein kinase [Rhodococcus sp. NPDC127528]|uniref:protein kinase domain-containing protein n=1 Tax=unclassified Rhodococcus (in: high G+C Gram-positive bacteria) TaxID=192944 RepID=UPI00363A2437